MMLLVDVAIIGLVALLCWRGFRSGMINSLCGLIAIILAFYGGFVVADIYSAEFSPVFEPVLSGFVDKSMSTVVNWQDGSKYATRPKVILEEGQQDDVYAVSYATYCELGIVEAPARSLAEETAEACPQLDQTVIVDITERICGRASFMITFYIAFALIAIIFFAIGNVLDLSFGLPGMETVNHLTGLAVSLVRAIALVMVLTCIFRYTGMLIPGEKLDATLLLRLFTNHNLAAEILGI